MDALAGTMQINFNARSQRFKGAKAKTDFDFRKRRELCYLPQISQEAENPCVFASWRLCVRLRLNSYGLVTCRGDFGRFDWVLRIQPLDAIGTNAVSKIGIRMGADIGFDLLPIPLIVANFFAGGANGQQAAEGLDMR